MTFQRDPSQGIVRRRIDLSRLGGNQPFEVVAQGEPCYAFMVNDCSTDQLPTLRWLFGSSSSIGIAFRGVGQRFRFQEPLRLGLNIVLIEQLAAVNAPQGSTIEVVYATDPLAADFLLAGNPDPWAFARRYHGGGLVTGGAGKFPILYLVNPGGASDAKALANAVNASNAVALAKIRLTQLYVTTAIASAIGFGNDPDLTSAILTPLVGIGLLAQGKPRRIAPRDLEQEPKSQLLLLADQNNGGVIVEASIPSPAGAPLGFPVAIELDPNPNSSAAPGYKMAGLIVQANTAAAAMYVWAEWEEREYGPSNL